MRIIISDSSCLIDLRKAALLTALLNLPYEIVIPNTLFEEELIKFSEREKKALLDNGLKVLDLPSNDVRRAIQLEADYPALSIHDCFAFALAESIPDGILLTGDGGLRTIANQHRIEVHGVLWAIDEIHKAATATVHELIQALELFESDPTIFRLPARDLKNFIRRYKSLVSTN
jgi:predicted nucleic acid-binding protein